MRIERLSENGADPLATARSSGRQGASAPSLAIRGVVWAMFFCGVGAARAQEWTETADAIGLKRVVLPADARIADLVADEGTLVEMPLGEWKKKLAAVEAGRVAAGSHPRLVKSLYRADLAGTNLTAGTGQWIVEHPGSSPALLPISSFNIALADPRLDDAAATIGEFADAGFGLWVAKSGRRAFNFRWSLRGTPTADGVTFDLRVPAAALGTVELNLPADQSPIVGKTGALLTGPHDSDKKGFKTWRIHLAGTSRIELSVRRGGDADGRPRLFSSIEAEVVLAPEQTLYDVEAKLEVVGSPISHATFEIDRSLQPYDVVLRQTAVETWKVEAATRDGTPVSLVHVEFREPLIGVHPGLRLRCAGPRWGEQQKTLPIIALANSISRGESLKLTIGPDQQLEHWDAGSFRLIDAVADKVGGRTLTLMETDPSVRGSRPKFSVRSGGVDYTVMQDSRWRIDGRGMTLGSELQFELSRGRLFALEVRLPKGGAWKVSSVELTPRDALQKWDVIGGVLRVDLQRGITPRTDVRLAIELADETSRKQNVKTFDAPDVEPLGARARHGSYAIFADANENVTLLQSNMPTSQPAAPLTRDPRLQYFFAYRTAPLQAKVRLASQQAAMQGRVQETILVSRDGLRVNADIAIEPILGQPRSVDVFIGDDAGDGWRIEARGADIARRERLPLLEAATLGLHLSSSNVPMTWTARLLPPRGVVWRVHFREPISKSATLSISRDLVAPAIDPERWLPAISLVDRGLTSIVNAIAARQPERSTPVIFPLDCERIDGEVLLQPVEANVVKVRAQGLDVIAGPSGRGFTRLLRLKQAGLLDAPRLSIQVDRDAEGDLAQAILERAELTTRVDPNGAPRHLLRLDVWNWRTRHFRVVLPPDSILLSGRLNGIDLDRIPQTPGPDGVEVLAPMSDRAGPQTIELSYRIGPSRNWRIVQEAGSPMPRLPLEPLVSRRRWQLAEGWLPIQQEQFFSFEDRRPVDESLNRLWTVGHEAANELLPSGAPEWMEKQRMILSAAENAARRNLPRETTLADLIAKLLETPQADVRLVIDREAFRGQRLGGQTPVRLDPDSAESIWTPLGLVVLTTPEAILLTTRDRQHLLAHPDSLAGKLLRSAVHTAFVAGQDESGRFRAADRWLGLDGSRDDETTGLSVATPFETTTWLPIAGDADWSSCLIVRSKAVRVVGLTLAAALLAAGLALARFASPRVLFAVAWVGLILGLSFLSFAPVAVRELGLAATAVFFVLLAIAYRFLLARRPTTPAPKRPSRSTQKMVVGGVAIVALTTMWNATAQAPAPRIVYVLGAEDAPNVRTFARPETVRWLDDQIAAAAPPVDAVFAAARYHGSWDGDAFAMKAELDVVAYRDGVTLIVPVEGVELLDGGRLDDQGILPTIAPKGGYKVDIPTAGRHRVVLPFRVRKGSAGEIDFSGPSTPCTSLTISAPSKLGRLRLVRGYGEENVRLDPKTGEAILEAQLGREPKVHVAGLTGAMSNPTTPLVKELYYWDLRPGHRTANAILSYQSGGETSRVEVKMPANLEVRSVELASADGTSPSGVIKSWRLVPRDNGHVLQVDMLQPIRGAFDLALGFVPRWNKGAAAFDLKLPYPLGASLSDGTIGVRFDEADAREKASFLGLAAASPEAFVKDWSGVGPRQASPVSPAPTRVFSFARATKNAPQAGLEIALVESPPRCLVDLALTVYPQAVDLTAELHATSSEPVACLPLDVTDAVVVRDIQGDDVHHWSRQGSSLTVWLSEPRKKAAITIVGTIPYQTGRTKSLAMPAFKFSGAAADAGSLTLASATGVALEPGVAKSLVEEAADRDAVRYRPIGGRFPSELRFKPVAPTVDVEALTSVDMAGDVCGVSTHLHVVATHGDYPEIRIRASRWPTAAPRLTTPPNVRVKASRDGEDHVWSIAVPPGSPQQMSFAVKGQLTLGGGVGELPEIAIENGGRLVASLVAFAGAEPVGPRSFKLTAATGNSRELAVWPLEQARLRAAGAQFAKMSPKDEAIRFRQRLSTSTPAAQRLTARHRVVPGSATPWLHGMEWTFWSPPGVDLDVDLPEGAEFEACLLDGQPVAPRHNGPDAFSLAVSGRNAIRTLAVFWINREPLETASRPRLDRAVLRGLEPPTVDGAIFLPPGWSLAGDFPESLTYEAALVDDVAARVRTVKIVGAGLAKAPRRDQGALQESLRSFAVAARQARYRLRVADDESLRERLEPRLTAEIDAGKKALRGLKIEALKSAGDQAPTNAGATEFPGSDLGAPLRWSQLSESAAPQFSLVKTTGETRSAMPLLALSIVALLAVWPAALTGWVGFWPEQLAALAVIGFVLGGFSLLGGAILVVAVAARGLSLRWPSARRSRTERQRLAPNS